MRDASEPKSRGYPVESFTEWERQRLEAHFSNLDLPVFAVFNLPEAVKGALFARYSRYQGTLRRLFLDEFAPTLPELGTTQPIEEGARAAALYDRIFLGYGDDSVAQLGGAHVACEWVSNVLTKVLQRPRLAAYLEQSTRYIAYDRPMPDGRYRYLRDPELGPTYEAAMDRVFEIYSELLAGMIVSVAQYFPPEHGEPPAAHERAVRAKALDLVRGLLPAGSLSHMGIYASGQTYEQLVLHLLGHPLPEARRYGQWILEAVRFVMPSFVSRVERPDRGGVWIDYLRNRDAAASEWSQRWGLDEDNTEVGPSVRLLRVEGDEEDLLCALIYEAANVGEEEIRVRLRTLNVDQRAAYLAAVIGERRNRRHRPGRGLEALRYRFEIISDYGAFRDLQRHRILTSQWQTLSPRLGASAPEEVETAGYGDLYREALEVSRCAYDELRDRGLGHLAPYAVCLAYRVRYILDLNAREALHVVELRSGTEGHASYRAVAQEMYRQIAAVHPTVAGAMHHVDLTADPQLERLAAEIHDGSRANRSGGRALGN